MTYRIRIVVESDRSGEWEEREEKIVSLDYEDENEAIVDLRYLHRIAERHVVAGLAGETD